MKKQKPIVIFTFSASSGTLWRTWGKGWRKVNGTETK